MENNFKIGALVCQTKFEHSKITGTAAPIPIAGLITKITPKYLHLKVQYDGWPGSSAPEFLELKMKKELFT